MWFVFILDAFGASSRVVQGDFCISHSFARRTGNENCWVRFNAGEDQSLCVSRKLWKKWLKTPHLKNLCSKWQGKWRVYSPLVNIHGESKKMLFSFYASELPHSEMNTGGILNGLIKQVEFIREHCAELVSKHDPLGIMRRLLVDERMPGSSERILRSLGFVHLLSASGIHLYALAGFISFMILIVTSRFGWPLGFSLKVSTILSFIVWCFGWLLGGMRPGMLRPLIVVVLRSIARSLGMKWRTWMPLALALSVDLTVMLIRIWLKLPGAWSPGRWHYALAVGGGLMAMELTGGWNQRGNIFVLWKKHFALSVGSWLFTAVWDAWELNMVAAATPILSFVTIPIFTVLVYPMLLLSVMFAFLDSAYLAELVVNISGFISTASIEWLARLCMKFDFLWVVPKWSVLTGLLGAGVVSIILWLYPKKNTYRVYAAIIVFLVMIRVLSGLIADKTDHRDSIRSVDQLDVGEGDSAVFFTQSGAGMIDAGSYKSMSHDRWLNIMAERGVTSLEWVALSHLDDDHAGGLQILADLLPIQCVVASERQWESDRGRILASYLKYRGVRTVSFVSKCFPYYSMELNDDSGKFKDKNSMMNVFYIPLQDGSSYLSAGDAHMFYESKIAKWFRAISSNAIINNSNSNLRIFKISHHGSRFSNTPELLQAIHPTEAWISVGTGNRYGHPTTDVLRILHGLKIKISRTDQQGYLSFRSAHKK